MEHDDRHQKPASCLWPAITFTNMIFRRKKSPAGSIATSVPRGRQRQQVNPLSRRMQSGEEPETVDLDLRRQTSAEPEVSGEAATRVLGERRHPDETPLNDPLAGWLVVISGPGQGNTVRIGYGVNSIGRDASQKISLDHGDERISRREHALLTYDPAERAFHIQHGGGASLTYLNEQVLLTPSTLKTGDQLRLGDTLLRFVPLCCESFDWQDIK